MRTTIVALVTCLAVWACGGDVLVVDAGLDGGSDSDADSDGDIDGGTDAGEMDGGGDADSDSDTDLEGDPCEQMEQLIDQAVSGYCAGKDGECCYCKCYNEGKLSQFTDPTCECIDRPAEDGGAGDTCQGADYTEAEDCLANVDACRERYEKSAQTGCLMSLL